MKEAIVILAVLAVLLVLTAVRYRRQIAGIIHIWRSFRAVREQISKGRTTAEGKAEAPAGALVNCARCGKWVPEHGAIGLRGGVFYCSTACLETSANVR